MQKLAFAAIFDSSILIYMGDSLLVLAIIVKCKHARCKNLGREIILIDDLFFKSDDEYRTVSFSWKKDTTRAGTMNKIRRNSDISLKNPLQYKS